MKVYIESNNGETLEFEVGSNSTIFEFKQLVQESNTFKGKGKLTFKNLHGSDNDPMALSLMKTNSRVLLDVEHRWVRGPWDFIFNFVPGVLTAGLFFGFGHYLAVKMLLRFNWLLDYAKNK